MKTDPFKEYIIQTEPSKRDKGYAWQTAIGLQAVDGLKPSEYLIATAINNIEGRIDMDEAQQLLDQYYRENPALQEDDRTEEADKVSARIAKLLSEKAFSFTPNQYLAIHKGLFSGIYKHAGQIRTYNITKKEWVLDGATVLYGPASELRAALEYDLSQEKSFSYRGLSMDETVHHLAVFVSRLWQIHVFAEGNTRTTAVFFIKYLRTLGFDVTNDIFAENAWYFRNALVRANYSDLKNGIHETTEFLELFLRNLLLGEKNALHNREMHISGKFGSNKKQDIEPEKQDIGHEEQDIHISTIYAGCVEGLSNKTIKNIEKVYGKLLGKEYFGRTDIVNILGITPSPASELIKKMLERQIICTVEGHGKGKYRFCDTGKN
ncbi:MAG: Fic family protein [Anaerovoracaceae bacterium]|nr:Fic family protein [Anaerovoracaceae bacterium]